MTKRFLLLVLLVVFVAAESQAQNRKHRRRGVVLGGLAGAAVGAAIGDKGDNETAGALIGGAVGAVAGGAIGNQKDRRIEQQHYHAHQTQRYRQQLSAQQAQQQASADWYAQQRIAHAVSMEDVVRMVRRGLGESTIVHHVRANGVRHRLAVADIISLHEQGVSEPIINAMQTAPVYAYPEMPVYGSDGYPLSNGSPTLPPSPYSRPVNGVWQSPNSPSSNVIIREPPPRPSRPIDPTRPYLFPAQ